MDRNDTVQVVVVIMYASLSARRVWIEMAISAVLDLIPLVALRKESVDRNSPGTNIILFIIVALRKESVDRNPCIAWQFTE